MREFKFFHKPKPAGNIYLTFDMDEVLIRVLRYKQMLNLDIINSSDTNLSNVNIPIDNCWMRIITWRTIDNVNPLMIEIDYRIFETNNIPRDYTYRGVTSELLSRIEITR